MRPFGELAPDFSSINSPTLDIARNVFPKAAAYGPVFAPAAVAQSALPSGCKGLWFVQTTIGIYATYAATATKLYKYNADTQSFDDVSRTVGGDYNLAEDAFWSGHQYGNRFIVCQLGDVPQYIDIDIGTNFAALPNAPTAKFVTVHDDKVVFYHLDSNPRSATWSDINDSENYTTGLSGTQEFFDHGAVNFWAPHAGIIILERGLRRIVSTGDVTSFSFYEMAAETGTTAPWSCVEYGSRVFYLSESGFTVVGGDGQPVNISDKRITSYFFENSNHDRLDQTFATFDPFAPRIYWAFSTSDTDYNNSIWVFDFSLPSAIGPFGRWSEIVTDSYMLARLATAAISLEGGSDPSDIDTPGLPSFDNRVYMAGAPILAIVGTDNLLATFSGDAMAATLEPAMVELAEWQRAKVRRAKLQVVGSTSWTAQVKKMGSLSEVLTASYSSAVSANNAGYYPMRADGKFHKFKFNGPAADIWTDAVGWDADYVPTSGR